MIRYIALRIVYGVLALWLVVTLVFGLFFIAPHDPSHLLAGRQASPEGVAAVRRSLFLDRSIVDQYWHFWDLVVHGQLLSFKTHETVFSMVSNALPATISLAIGAALLWVISGVAIGVLAARHPRSLVDRAVTVFVLTFLSTPTFVVGLGALYFLFYLPRVHGFELFPAPGYVPLSAGALSWAHALVLPWITLALATMALYSRLTRSSLLDVLGEDYIRTARAKGLSERRVIYRHGLRSAMTPIMTQFGLDLASFFGGVIVTETVFGINGMGRLVWNAITVHDLPVVMGVVVLSATFIILANIVVDVLYAVLDPRVRYA